MCRLIVVLYLAVGVATFSIAANPDNSSPVSANAERLDPAPIKIVERHALKVDYGKIILLRYKTEAIALKFTRATETADGGARYRIWVNHRGPQRFHEGRFTKIKGEVFEQFDDAHLNSRESDTYVRCGAFKLGWSKMGPDRGYIYFHHPKKSDLNIALTEWSRVKDVDFTSKELQWSAWDGKPNDSLFLGGM